MGIPERFKIIRDSLGLSQKDMATTIGVSLPGLQGYEAGRSVPGGNVFESLVKLGFNANWLLTGDGDMRLREGSQTAAGNGFLQGHSIDAENIHIDVHNGHIKEPREGYPTAPDIDVRIQHLYSAFRGDIHKLMAATILVDMTATEVDALSRWMKDNVTIKERGLLNKG